MFHGGPQPWIIQLFTCISACGPREGDRYSRGVHEGVGFPWRTATMDHGYIAVLPGLYVYVYSK